MALNKKSKLKLAQEETQAAVDKTNKKIEELGKRTGGLCDALNALQNQFDEIRNVPSDKKAKSEELKKIRLEWKQQAQKIEDDYNAAAAKTAGAGAAGVGFGVAAVAMGPTVAMGIATTFGVASTGTAISALSGAAATNAALAWLGGGALVAGGGGMVAGNAFLALFGPVGWTIAGVATVTSGLMLWKTFDDKKKLKDIFTIISERDIKSYKLAIVELEERIKRVKEETELLNLAVVEVEIFGTDYDSMTEAQQYKLGAYLNLMESSTQLLVNPIMGLLPKVGESDFTDYVKSDYITVDEDLCNDCKGLIISLANLLYKIQLDNDDRQLLYKSFKSNKKFLEAVKVDKKDFCFAVMDAVDELLDYCYEKTDQ